MNRIPVFISFMLLFFLQGCPMEEEPFEPDQNLYVRNALSDTVQYLFIYRNKQIGADGSLTQKEVDLIFNDILRGNTGFTLLPFEKRLINRINRKQKENSPTGDHYFFINRDSVLSYTSQTWDRRAGLKYYYLYSLEDYERINFTFEYP